VATYGIDYYGKSFYGNQSLANFDATPFTASPIDYGKIYLSWNTPTGDWSGIRLIRNTYGFPETADDGVVLVDALYGAVSPDFYDPSPVGYAGTLPTGQYFYYSIFVKDTGTGQWLRAGNAAGLSVKSYDSGTTMYNYLPDIYKVPNLDDAVDGSDNPTLQGFLNLFGFYYDIFRTETEIITDRYNIQKVPGSLLPGMMQQFGLQFQPELGFKRARSLLANTVHINQSKGSLTGVQDYIKAFTGNAATITMGKNLMLDINDSSFEQSIGSWTATNATLSHYTPPSISAWAISASTSTSVLTLTVSNTSEFTTSSTVEVYGATQINGSYTVTGVTTSAITMVTATPYSTAQSGTGGYVSHRAPYNETSNPYSNNSRLGSLKVVAAGSSTITLKCLNTSSAIAVGNVQNKVVTTTYYQTPVTHGIPVTSGTTYTFSYKAWSDATARSFTAGMSWYDRTGTIIGSASVSSPTTSTTTGWTTLSQSASAPSGAIFAVPQITIASPSTSQVHYIDAAQFEASASATYFQESRQLQVKVQADRVNELKNPNFEYSTVAPWTATNGTLDLATDELVTGDSPNIPVSGGAGEIYSTSTSAVTVSSAATSADYMPILPNDSYTFSGYVRMSSDGTPTAQTVFVEIDWYDSTDTLISSDFSANFTVPLTPFTRFSFTATSPSAAASCVVKFQWPNPSTSGIAILMDSFMLERSAFVGDYFDGSNGYADLGDVTWQGTTNDSRSHYYRNRFATQTLLQATLPNYVNLGTNFALLYAQP